MSTGKLANGKITGVTEKMEYSDQLKGNYIPCIKGDSITGLKAGDYYVRFMATKTQNASIPVLITVFEEEKSSSGNGSGGSSQGDGTKVQQETLVQIKVPGESDTRTIAAMVTTTIKDGTSLVSIKLSQKELEELITESAKKNIILELGITLPTNKLVEQFNDKNIKSVTTELVINKELRNKDKVVIKGLTLEKTVLLASKKVSKDITALVSDEEGKTIYQWTFKADDLNQSKKDLGNVDLSLYVQQSKDNKDLNKLLQKDKNNSTGSIVEFGEKKVLPSQASVKTYVGDIDGLKANGKAYIYSFNSKSKKLEELPYNIYKVDKDGYLTMDIVKGSDYVVLPKVANKKIVTSLVNQIRVGTKYTISKGKGKMLAVTLPVTLEKVSSNTGKTSSSAIGAAKVSFKTSNKKIASVNASTGKITGKKAGKTTITTIIKLYSGVTKTFKTTVTIK